MPAKLGSAKNAMVSEALEAEHAPRQSPLQAREEAELKGAHRQRGVPIGPIAP